MSLAKTLSMLTAVRWDFKDGLEGWATSTEGELDAEVSVCEVYVTSFLTPIEASGTWHPWITLPMGCVAKVYPRGGELRGAVRGPRPHVDSPRLAVDCDDSHHLVLRMAYTVSTVASCCVWPTRQGPAAIPDRRCPHRAKPPRVGSLCGREARHPASGH
jgi:hypothetical protein